MPAETAQVFLYCLRSEEAKEGSDEQLLEMQLATAAMWAEMGAFRIEEIGPSP